MTEEAAADGDTPWVIPSEIRFDTLLGKDLEECVYWLLDAMGAQDLEWRVGGTGGGAADGGRDLAAAFYALTPAGDMDRKRWWFECKGRSKTLEADQVKAAVNNALGEPGLDYIVIVTNTTFTNPTRDWVVRWQQAHPTPVVQLWDGVTLERMLSRQPQVVMRLFAQALSLEGRVKAAKDRFWGRLEFVAPKQLAEFWAARREVDLDGMTLFALIATEFAAGSIAQRPWAADLDKAKLAETLQYAIANIFYLIQRAEDAGQRSEPLLRAQAYVVLVALQAFGPTAVTELLRVLMAGDPDNPYPDVVQSMLLMPIIDQLLGELQEVCSSDCQRFTTTLHALRTEDGDEVEDYWWRLDQRGLPRLEDPTAHLRLERTGAPCKVGFALNDEVTCPLFDAEPTLENLEAMLTVFAKVSAFRKIDAQGRHAERVARIAEFNASPLRRPPTPTPAEGGETA